MTYVLFQFRVEYLNSQNSGFWDSLQLGFATGSAILGCIAGPFLGVWLGDRLGRKNCLFLAALLFAVSAIGSALPRSITEFNIY